MALFLSESIRTSVKSISLNEALTDLVVLMDEGQSLTEALYQADFIKFLNESEIDSGEMYNAVAQDAKDKYKKVKTGKDMNFIQRAWEAIKTFSKKVWMKVVQVFNAVKNKITVWFHRIMGNKSEIFNANKSIYQMVKVVLDSLDEQLILAQRRWNDADDAKEAFEKLEEKFKDKIDSIDQNEDDYVKISKSELKQLASRGTKAINDLDKVEKMAKSHVEAAEQTVKRAAPEDKEKAEKLLKQVKFETRVANTLAGKSAKIGTLLATMVSMGQKSADAEEDDEKANKK